MKKVIISTLMTVALMAAFSASAKSADLGFRIGKVLSAEISSVPPEIISLDRYPNALPAKRIYAVVVLKMTPNRSLSALDYSLVINKTTSPCIAIVCNMASFVCDPEATYPSEKDYARLLFIIDANRVKLPAAGKTIKATLKTNIKNRNNVALNVLSKGNAAFSDCTKLPADGALK